MSKIKLRDGTFVLVDSSDFENLNKYSWGLIKNSSGYTYAARGTRKNGVYSKILMHKEILPSSDKSLMVDHINGNTLDNRKCNLRLVKRSQNLQNSKLRKDSKCNYKGVSKRGNKFIARIQISKEKRLYLGRFNTEIEAAKAYDNAAKKYFTEYAKLNFKD